MTTQDLRSATAPAAAMTGAAPWVPGIVPGRALPPYLCEGVESDTYYALADYTTLKGLVDRYLNGPANAAQKWHPMGGVVQIQILRYDRLISEPYREDGYIAQNELAISIPIYHTELSWDPIQFGMFSAFLVVDNPLSLTGGREVIGYPKHFGAFDLSARSGSVDMWLNPEFSRDSAFAPKRLMDIGVFDIAEQSGLPDVTASHWPLGPIEMLLGGQNSAPAMDLTEDAIKALERVQASNGLTSVHLQQLKQVSGVSATDTNAVYQSRIAGRSTLTEFRSAWPLLPPVIQFTSYETLDLVDTFGLKTMSDGKTLKIFYGFRMNIDFKIHDIHPISISA